MKKTSIVIAILIAVTGYVKSKNAVVLPQRPRFQEMLRSTLSRPRSDAVGNAIDTGLLVYESVQTAAAWLKGIKDRTKKKEEYLFDNPEESPLNSTDDMQRLMDEIEVCKPYQRPREVCHSRCMPWKHYRFCWVTRRLQDGDWAPCTCRIRRSVKQYLIVIKEELVRRFRRLQDLQHRALSPLEIVLLVVAGISVLTILILAVVWCRNRKAHLTMHRRLTEAASNTKRASLRTARRASCAISRHLPKASTPQPPAAEAMVLNAESEDVEIH